MYHKKAHPFYGTQRWKHCREAYARSKHYVCEKCGKPADVVHHIQPLTGTDYWDNPEKCFGADNLMCLCHTCHNNIHHSHQQIADGYTVNMVTGEIEVSPPGVKNCANLENRYNPHTKN